MLACFAYFAVCVTVLSLICILLIPARVKIKLKMRSGFTNMGIKILLGMGIIPITLSFRAVYSRGEGLYLGYIRKNGSLKKIIYPGMKVKKPLKLRPWIFSSVIRGIKLKNFELLFKIGTRDPYSTVMICAAARTVIDEMYNIVYKTSKSSENAKKAIVIIPNMERPEFILNLECIIQVNITKIIVNILKSHKKRGI